MSVRTQPFTARFTRVIVSLAWTLILISLAGCSVGDFIGAYFNTYYNAQRLFSEAEEELSKQSATRQTEKVFLAPIAVPAATKTKLTSVVEKCSKLLQYHPESELVDDALMMIGKSYYYQNEHQKAERKFREIMDGYPESDLAFEARLLLSYTLYRMNDKAKAGNVAKELVDTTKLEDPDIAANASVLLAEIERENENYEEAIFHYQKAAELGESADDRMDSYMKLAELYSLEGDDKSALEAYRRAEESSTSYLSRYQALMGLARKLSKLGNFEASFELLDDLRSNSNNKDFFGEIELEIGNVFQTMNDVEGAITQYVYVDTTYAKTEASANSYYQLGHLYETILFQYDSARIAYNQGKTEFPQARITETLVYRSEYLNKYYTFQKEISKYDSLRALILNPPVMTTPAQNETSADSSAATTDTSVTTQDVGVKDSSAIVSDSTRQKLQNNPSPASLPTLRTVDSLLAHNKMELGGLFYSTIGMMDSAEVWYRRLVIDHPNSKPVPRALFTLAQIYALDKTVGKSKSDSLHSEIVSIFPDSEFADESRRILGLEPRERKRDEAESAYVRGEKLMKAGNNSAAIDTFAAIVVRYPSSPLAPKAQYAIGWIYERMNSHLDSAIVSFQRLVDLYPKSQHALLIRPKLNEVEAHRRALEQAQKDSAMQKDSLSQTPVRKEIPGMQEEPIQGADQIETKELDRQSSPDTPEEDPEKKPKPR
ncbi:MAG: tetratricopeptide repeat protein [Ignavibacteria bacterium]|nr:tetratricopeptide repeat protein [Ignavibacteria bacterium]